jgi:mRNA interferase RelE/StbE
MSAALQVYHRQFDLRFFKLPAQIQAQIEAKIDQMGLRLERFPHYRLTGSNRYRLRVGDYRVIYACDPSRNVIHLLAVGHRREIYRKLE